MGYDVERVRADFPILAREVHGKRLVYLDNAASSQKPRAVIEAVSHYYESFNANIHRGVHTLSEQATAAYEEARAKVARFVGARETREVVFVRGTTEAINLVAQAWARPRLAPGDEILISHMEHHSNIVPWQILCRQTGAVLRVAPIDERGDIVQEAYLDLLGPRTRMVALPWVSNALGTVNPIHEMVRAARECGATVLVDGAQAVPHLVVDVAALDCDFFAFSGHKMYAPMGVGALVGRAELLDEMEPYQGGGEMIISVTFDETKYNVVPHKFEAGTPNVGGVIGLGAAVDYLTGLGLDEIARHERELLAWATEQVGKIEGVRLIGTAREKAGVLAFTVGDVHAHDVGTILDREGVAVRTGHHCAQPVIDFFGVPATVRASFGLYNTRQEVERLAAALETVQEIFRA